MCTCVHAVANASGFIPYLDLEILFRDLIVGDFKWEVLDHVPAKLLL